MMLIQEATTGSRLRWCRDADPSEGLSSKASQKRKNLVSSQRRITWASVVHFQLLVGNLSVNSEQSGNRNPPAKAFGTFQAVNRQK